MQFANFSTDPEWGGAVLTFADAKEWCQSLDAETSARAATLKPQSVAVDRGEFDRARAAADQTRADYAAAQRSHQEADKRLRATLSMPPDAAVAAFAKAHGEAAYHKAQADALRETAAAADKSLSRVQAEYNAALAAARSAALKVFVAEQEETIRRHTDALPDAIRGHLVEIGSRRKAVTAATT